MCINVDNDVCDENQTNTFLFTDCILLILIQILNIKFIITMLQWMCKIEKYNVPK